MAGDSKSENIGDTTTTLYVRCPSNGTKFAVEARLESTVKSLKSVIEDKCEIPSWEQSLIFRGRVLMNKQSLQSYGIKAEDTVHLARGWVPGCGRSPPRVNGVIPLQHTPSLLGPTAHVMENMYDSDPQFREIFKNDDIGRLLPKPWTMGQLMTHSLCIFSGLDGDVGQNECAGVTPARVYDTIRADLQDLGFFDVRVNVESSNVRFNVEINLLASVESFKSVLEPIFEIPAARQCLLYQAHILEDGQTLLSYGGLKADTVYLIVLEGPPLNPPANHSTGGVRTSADSPAYVIQGIYDSDPLYRQMMKSPALFHRFCTQTSWTEEEGEIIYLSLLSQLYHQQQTTGDAGQTRGATGNVTVPNNSNGYITTELQIEALVGTTGDVDEKCWLVKAASVN